MDASSTQPSGDAQALWARTLLSTFAACGVRDVVISPGSRSTPFVLAAVEHPKLRCHHVVDERSAAFFALGQARLQGRPSLLLCTSGTAVANYFPAVVEAGMAHVPLLVLSADRPVELAHCGANQTIDQQAIFGHHARRFFDLGRCDVSGRALRALRRTVAQAVFASSYPQPGAVHLNARAKKPLEPSSGAGNAEDKVTPRIAQPRTPQRVLTPDDLDSLVERLRSAERGLLVMGPGPVEQGELRSVVGELARRSRFVVLADPASQWRYGARSAEATWVDAYDTMLHSGWGRLWRPDCILQIGRAPTSGAFDRQLEAWRDIDHWVLSPDGWNDPQSTADHLLFADLVPTLDEVVEGLPAALKPATPWQRGWQEAEEIVQQLADEALREGEEAGALSEGAIARLAVDALPDGGVLMLGNSLPIREVDIYGPGVAKELAVVSQRGSSGIDGLISGALGSAQAGRRPTLLLIGDVSFLHDLGGLASANMVDTPTVLLVVQNNGGRIFEQLPVRDYLAARKGDGDPGLHPQAMDAWTTPHQADFQHAAGLHGLPFQRVDGSQNLQVALAEAMAHPGVSVVEAVVPPDGARLQNTSLRRAARAALTEAGLL